MSDQKGISILIPIYNFEVSELVKNLVKQASELNIPFEIRCYDDYSESYYREANKKIKTLDNIIYSDLPQNLGRSKIRNKLGKEATYSHLLFIDCDSKIVRENFLKNYLELSDNIVAVGGTVYTSNSNNSVSLRFTYGKNREQKSPSERMKNPYHSLNLNNLFVSKNIFIKNLLDETILTYGHEDTKFGYELKKNGIEVRHIDNPVEHIGLETNEVFLKKTREGVKNFYKITQQGFGCDTKLYRSFMFLKKYKLKFVFTFFYNIFSNVIFRNLNSPTPSLLFFDLYKLKLLIDEEKNK